MKRPNIAGVTLLLVLAAGAAHAQGIGINGTGAQADASAMLDVAATNKGLLLPRMTAAQRAAIASPATGLVVYQTDAPAGLYYNAGTPGSPSWQLAGSAGAAGQWSTSGADLYYSSGKVGIGTTPVNGFGLTIVEPSNGLRVQTNLAGGSLASFGGVGTFGIDGPGVIGGRLQLLENGNLGLGNGAPTNPLSFASTLGKKISLFHDATGGDYGLGIEGSRLKLYGGYSGADVALGYDNAGTFVERLAVKPTGAIAVSGNAGAAGQVLQSNGAGAAASWATPPASRYDNTYQAVCTGSVTVGSSSGLVAIPGLSQSFTVAGNAHVIVHYNVPMTTVYCFACGESSPNVFAFLDGAYAASYSMVFGQGVANEHTVTMSGTLMLDVGAGTHTVDMRARDISGPDVSVGYNSLMSCTLVLEVIPQ